MAPARSIALAEVEKHVAPDDLWLVIAGKVYDVTAFMDDHPGGGEIMLNAAGKDGTDDFEDVGHSPNAYEQLKKFYIGEYAGGASGRADGGANNMAAPIIKRRIYYSLFHMLHTNRGSKGRCIPLAG